MVVTNSVKFGNEVCNNNAKFQNIEQCTSFYLFLHFCKK